MNKNDNGLELKYFVLKPRSKNPEDRYAMASRVAMIAFADAIKETNPQLCDDLNSWVDMERKLSLISNGDTDD